MALKIIEAERELFELFVEHIKACEKPVLKLMFGALVRAAERWRGLRFTEFESPVK